MSVRVRPARSEDIALYAELFVELGLDEPPPSEERIAALLPTMQIAETAAPCGFVIAYKEGDVGFVRQIVVAPHARRSGVGRALMAAAADHLKGLGIATWRLNVKEDNVSALALYRALGMRVVLRSSALWIRREARLRIPASETPLVVFEPPPEDVPALEHDFAILPGQLRRGTRGALVLAVRRALVREASGVMYLVPSFPGASPFCARDAASARALLGEALRLASSAERIGVVIERDDQLVDALVATGSQLRFHMLQLEGAI